MTATLHVYIGDKAVGHKLLRWFGDRSIISKLEKIKRGHYRFTLFVPALWTEENARKQLATAFYAVGDDPYERPVWTQDMEAMNTGTQHLGRAMRPVPEAPAVVRDWSLDDRKVHSNVSRSEREYNHAWMNENPALFAASLIDFQKNFPITHWQHHIDMSLGYTIKLIATRRETPFLDTQEYLKHSSGNLYLHEIGMKG